MRHHRSDADKCHADFTGQQRGRCGTGAALVRDVHQVNAGQLHELLHFQTAVAAGAGGTVIELALLQLGESDELLHVFNRHRGMCRQSHRHVDDLRHRDKITHRAHREFRVDARVDRHGADIAEQEGVTVCWRLCRDLDTDVAGSACTVVDQDLLAEFLLQPRLHQAPHQIRCAARRKRHHHAHSAYRINIRRLCR